MKPATVRDLVQSVHMERPRRYSVAWRPVGAPTAGSRTYATMTAEEVVEMLRAAVEGNGAVEVFRVDHAT